MKDIIEALVILVYSVLVRGFVLANLWNWFMVGALGVPELTYWYGAGLNVLFIFTGGLRKSDFILDDYVYPKTIRVLITFMIPWATLGVGYLITLFI